MQGRDPVAAQRREGNGADGPAAFAAYELILESMLDGALLTGPEGDVVLANEAAARIFGVPRTELLAPVSTYPDRFGLMTPERERPEPIAKRALAGEVVRPVERLIRTPSGREKIIRTSAAPLRDERGSILGALVLLLDITAAKEGEAQMRQQEEQLRQQAEMLEYAPVLVRDLGDTVVLWSRGMERLYGWTSEEALGKRTHDLLQTRFPRPLPEIREELFRTGRWEGELVHRHRDGREVVVTSLWIVHCDGENCPEAIIEVNGDITERKRAEEALREADQRKTEFLGVLSHELRNPLAPIRSGIWLLDRAPAGSAAAGRAMESIRRQAEHLTRLVDDLLDVTRIARGKVQLRRERIDLREVVHRTAEDLRTVFDRSGVELRAELSADPVWVNADPTRMAQVVGNLLQNADKFTPARGAVTVQLSTAGGHAELRVRDTGVGIDPQHLYRVFEPFNQEERSLARTRGGLGLGLALARGLVELHGGSIEARSEGLGRGAEFVVRLPLETPAPQPELSPTPSPAARTEARRVLIVEDNEDAAETLADVLSLEGHEVQIARDGSSGIAMARALNPDVVLCDIGLPDVDGYAVARALRDEPALRATRLVALSGYAQPEDKLRARDAGFDGHVSKPPALGELSALVARGRRTAAEQR